MFGFICKLLIHFFAQKLNRVRFVERLLLFYGRSVVRFADENCSVLNEETSRNGCDGRLLFTPLLFAYCCEHLEFSSVIILSGNGEF